jgi:hypothetical protein
MLLLFASSSFIQVNVPLGNEVAKRINREYIIREPIPKFQFLKTK